MSSSFLLQVPAELRNKIWDYALENEPKTLQHDPRTKRFDVSRIGAGLLTTCHSTFFETLYAPLRLNSLVFNPEMLGDVDMWILPAKLERLGQDTQGQLGSNLVVRTLGKPRAPCAKMPTNASKNLAGKTVLITGASSGIGRSCAFEFARTSPESLKIILTARRVDRLYEIAKEITNELGGGVKIHSVRLDVSKPDEVTKLWQELPEDFKEVDILVNNAGFMSGYERAPDIPPNVIDDVFATNVTGWINMTQEFLKIAKKRDGGGSGDVVMIGSIAGRDPYAGGSIYCASKAAIRSFTEALRKELIATKIRVITVDPGQVLTEFTIIRNRGDEASADKIYEGCDPLTPDDVAEVVVFACSRRGNVVVADSLLYPTYQASSLDIHRRL
ncbi:oxidoreductase [Stagonosporopsis vannaccii]|nr:oxidoreductase [Stagonosporopsis vannaccii]